MGRASKERRVEPDIETGLGGAAINLTDVERAVSGVAGLALTLYGARRRGVSGAALALIGTGLLYRTLTGHSRLYEALGLHLVRTTRGAQRIEVVRNMTINRRPEELYQFWRRLENLPRIMRHLESVREVDGKRSHWIARSPGGGTIEWDAEIVNEKENTLLAWQSCEGSDIAHWGVVRFAPAPDDRGTEVTIELEYEPVAGTFGAAIGKLLGEEPGVQLSDDLRRFKQLMEAGEVPTIEGQPRGPKR